MGIPPLAADARLARLNLDVFGWILTHAGLAGLIFSSATSGSAAASRVPPWSKAAAMTTAASRRG